MFGNSEAFVDSVVEANQFTKLRPIAENYNKPIRICIKTNGRHFEVIFNFSNTLLLMLLINKSADNFFRLLVV